MTRFFSKKSSKKVGLAPGTLVYTGDKKIEKARITVISYDEALLREREVKTVEECCSFRDKPAVVWINIDGIHDTDTIEKLGQCFDFHPLILEDIVNTSQRPKLEDYDNYLFIVLKMLHYEKNTGEIETEQVSLVLGSNFVISYQEKEGDVFNPVRDRIRSAKGNLRKMGADFLAYSLIDAIVDNYFLILEKVGERIEGIEEELITSPSSEGLQEIHNLKKEMIFIRRSVWPLREVISKLQRSELPLIKEPTKVFLRDVYDHTIQIIDTVESFRDMIVGMLDIYLSSISNKMNEVMKVLTIFAAIFIPLTLVTGIYGMNFKFMPELEWHWGYFSVLGFMTVTGVSMVIYFKRKKWF